jgi:hypothetical protein
MTDLEWMFSPRKEPNLMSGPRVYAVECPEEPPVGSVVVDSESTAWQCRSGGGCAWWWPTDSESRFHPIHMRWADLLHKYGPVTEVWRPEKPTSEEN